MKASDLMVKCLEREGIEYVFGVPGEENADFLISLDASEQIRFINCRHEQGAAFMADVYGRLTGNPALALATLGPGATNLMTGVANATFDRSPMLVLTGQGGTSRQHKESHQVFNVVDMFEPVTKWSHAIRQADNIPEVIRKAVRRARMEKPGAVHMELAEDIAKQQAGAEPMSVKRFRRPMPDGKALDRAAEMLRKAKRPIILAGNGAIRKRSSNALRRFAADTGIGVICTFMGKGSIDRDAEQCLFTIGLQQKDYPALAIDESDLVLTVGYDMIEYPPRLWNAGCCHPVIHLDFEAAEIDADYHPDVELVADVASSIRALHAALEQKGRGDFDLNYQQTRRRQMIEDFEAHAEDDTEGSIRPQKVIWDVREALDRDDILLCDVGAHKMWVGRYYQCHEPNTCLISNGLAAMGFALPGSIAAALVHPDRQVLAICGDGAFMMNVQEMETARRLNVDITVLVWVDNDYGLITWKQDDEFGRHMDMTFGNPDWIKLADAFGWAVGVVGRSRDLRPALDDALKQPGPSLLAIPIDYRENDQLTNRLGRIECAL